MLMLYVAEDINASSDWSSDQEEEKNSSEFFEIQGIARYMMRGREEAMRMKEETSVVVTTETRICWKDPLHDLGVV